MKLNGKDIRTLIYKYKQSLCALKEMKAVIEIEAVVSNRVVEEEREITLVRAEVS
ncbi:hypothetical protein [Domibacillus mangrovi]|uniref:hypothetical protein n=1 Tax=Domibacillus mangrovi TaxID=1714354 RepID=UPI000B1CE62E|nr:hypothetical protein [Domibacillus mangrovi]